MRINTNSQSQISLRHLTENSSETGKVIEKMASGSRINRAADDAAGLSVSENLRSSIRSLGQARQNALEGIGMLQVTEGALNEIGNMLIRLRELSIQAASDTIGNEERYFMEREITHVVQEIDRIGETTEYNGVKTLNGVRHEIDLQVGIYNNPLADRISIDTFEHVANSTALMINSVTVITQIDAGDNLGALDTAISLVAQNRAVLGAIQNRLVSTIENLAVTRENDSAAQSRIKDADYAEYASKLASKKILTEANIAVLAQSQLSARQTLRLLKA